ncbi:MAG: DUF4738 domain-containing protein [Prevotella sp.]|nr:DUF4738 domain-containing protein [Prevotella sp.]
MRTRLQAWAVLFLICSVALCGACEKKKETRRIVTKITRPAVREGITALPETSVTRSFVWGDASYEATITRTPDKEQPVVTDADGNRYYDNDIRLTILSPSGKLTDRVFHKGDFAAAAGERYARSGAYALLNMVFHEVVNNEAVFIATIGSPDELDDVYVLTRVMVSKTGALSMSRIEEIEEPNIDQED